MTSDLKAQTLNLSIVYGRTDLGQAMHAGTQPHVLSAWAKHLLRMIDGHKNCESLAKLLPTGQFAAAADELLSVSAITAKGAAKPTTATAQPVLVTKDDVEKFRSKILRASHYLDDKMGMDATKLQLELEACKQPADLVSAGSKLIAIVRMRLGDKAANEFALLLQ
jgi:hypothetical protein